MAQRRAHTRGILVRNVRVLTANSELAARDGEEAAPYFEYVVPGFKYDPKYLEHATPPRANTALATSHYRRRSRLGAIRPITSALCQVIPRDPYQIPIQNTPFFSLRTMLVLAQAWPLAQAQQSFPGYLELMCARAPELESDPPHP